MKEISYYMSTIEFHTDFCFTIKADESVCEWRQGREGGKNWDRGRQCLLLPSVA